MIHTIQNDFKKFEPYDVVAMQNTVGQNVEVREFGVPFGASSDFGVEQAVANLLAHGLNARQVDDTTFTAEAFDGREYTVSLDLVAPASSPSSAMDEDHPRSSKKRKLVTEVLFNIFEIYNMIYFFKI